MRPVNHTTAVIPLVATAHIKGQSLPRRYAPREIDIMCHQYSVSAIQLEHKPLMPCTLVIILQHALDSPAGLEPLSGSMRGVGRLHGILSCTGRRLPTGVRSNW